MAATAKAKNNIVPLPGVKAVIEKKIKKSIWLRPGPLMLVMLLSFVLYSFGLQIVQMQKNVHTMAQIEAQIKAVADQNAELKKEIKKLKTNGYIERQAREKLGLVKPGEKMIIEIVPGKKVSP